MEDPIASKRAEMPQGSQSILDQRTLETDHTALIDILIRGDHVLDVGCGSGAITKGIMDKVGPYGKVIGIDSSEHLISSAKKNTGKSKNLHFELADIHQYTPKQPFDVITAARVIQWLNQPEKALEKMYNLLKEGGCLCILDYNHEKLEWDPAPPKSMRDFYKAFLKWRKDAGMDNGIADHLQGMFAALGLKSIHVSEQHELYQRGDSNFLHKAGIWAKVAESRGKQMQQENYISEADRTQTITEYTTWVNEKAQSMKMYLLAVSGYK